MAKPTSFTAEYKKEIIKLVTEKGKPRNGVAISIGVSKTTINEWIKRYSVHGENAFPVKGNCFDNACAESFFATLKKDIVRGERYRTREEAKIRIIEYIELFYNCKRIHSSINDMSPIEFELSYYQKMMA